MSEQPADLVPSALPEAAGSGLSPAEQLVLRWLVTKRSAHTRYSYGTDLGVRIPRPGVRKPDPAPRPAKSPSWLAWCRAHRIDPLGMVPDEAAAAWARRMEDAGLSPATVARRLAAVSSWYTWLVRNGHAPANPAANLDRPEINADIGKTPGLSKEQALAVLAYADGAATPAARRNSALAHLLIYTGARIHEITAADTGDLGFDQGHRVLWVTRKGGKAEPVVVPPPALHALEAYFAGRDDMRQLPARPGEVNSGTAPLIATLTGRRLRDDEGLRIMRRLARGAGLPPELVQKIAAHTGRVVFATLALDAGVELANVQDALGHKDPRTTRRYDRQRSRLAKSPGYALASYLSGEANNRQSSGDERDGDHLRHERGGRVHDRHQHR